MLIPRTDLKRTLPLGVALVATALLAWVFRPDVIDADEYAVYNALCGPTALVCSEVDPIDGRPAGVLSPTRCKFHLLTPSELEHWFGSGRDEAAWERFRQASASHQSVCATISRVQWSGERSHATVQITGHTGPVDGPTFTVELNRAQDGRWNIEGTPALEL